MKRKKVDLHLHLDGSLRPVSVLEMGREQGVALPADTAEELKSWLRVSEDCSSLNEYLEKFELPLKVLQVPSAIERAVFELIEDLAAQGLIYAEIRFAPQLSVQKGMSQREVTEAAVAGMKRGLEAYPSIRARLILCCMRGSDNDKWNYQTLETASEYLGKGVCAVDLAGAEALYRTEHYEDLFAEARNRKLPFTIHAGEADGAESVRKALEYGAHRIGHGVRVIEDAELLDTVIKKGITLEVCPTSNLHTRLITDPTDHPIRRLFDAGARVTVNTDNMTVSDTTLEKEYAFLKKYCAFTETELDIMSRYALEAAFAFEGSGT